MDNLLSKIQDPETMKRIMKVSEINRKEKRGDISAEEAAEQVVDLAEEDDNLRDVLGLVMQNFSHDDVAEEIEAEMIERFGKDWEE